MSCHHFLRSCLSLSIWRTDLCLFWCFIVTVKCILEMPNWIHMQLVLPFLSVKREDMVPELFLMFSTGMGFQNPSWTSKSLVCSHGFCTFLFIFVEEGHQQQSYKYTRETGSVCRHMCVCKWISLHSYTCKFDVCTYISTCSTWDRKSGRRKSVRLCSFNTSLLRN